MNNALRATVLISLAAVVLVGCGSNARPAASSSLATDLSATHTITTQATGLVTGTPDEMSVVLGVQTSASTANSALADNNVKASSVIATLKAKGVLAADLQTSGLSIQPNYNAKNVITGYQVSNTVTATLHNLATAGGIIDAAASAAGDATRIQQVGFSIADDTALLAQARAKAVQQAQAQAGQIAKAAGSKLDDIRSITEVPQGGQQISNGSFAAPAASAGVPFTPVQAGSQQLSVSVTVSYNIG